MSFRKLMQVVPHLMARRGLSRVKGELPAAAARNEAAAGALADTLARRAPPAPRRAARRLKLASG
ncbi:hypothetical protein PMES_02010 [Profundibacterium mesophilum KAUST100406-0324]|uniref:Uncharacterized protein n=1 Tax=Profundibacterium mesophilum KAUST100406-0324 TaxID=1037889 RepID=A0A921TBH9_9RHOB|nr:hypothetical protein PMES_02010 [Profundibacterium mesophilum KAUST100406-0324]